MMQTPAATPDRRPPGPETGPVKQAARRRATRSERAVVLGGFAAAALWTACSALAGACSPGSGEGMEAVAAAWLGAALWAAVASLALALRRGLSDRDWSAFGRHAPPHDTELVDWSTASGGWFDMALAEEHERLMRGD